MTETNDSLPEALKTTPVPERKAEEVTPPPVIEPALEEGLNDEDEALDLESDGDVFWLIQRVLWGILKLVGVLALIGGVAWLIWGELPHKKVDIKETKEKVEKITEKIIPKDKKKSVQDVKPVVEKDLPTVHQPVVHNGDARTDGALVGAGWNYWMENQRLSEQNDAISEALLWTKKTGAFFDTPLTKMIVGDSPVVRSRNLDRVVTENYRLMESAQPIRLKLESQITELAQKSEAKKQEYETYKAALGQLLKDSNPDNFDETWSYMMEAEKQSLDYSRQVQLRQQLVQSMGRYYLGLKDTYEMLVANRRAIVENIKVVQFPWDPFGQIVSPTQWREAQAQ